MKTINFKKKDFRLKTEYFFNDSIIAQSEQKLMSRKVQVDTNQGKCVFVSKGWLSTDMIVYDANETAIAEVEYFTFSRKIKVQLRDTEFWVAKKGIFSSKYDVIQGERLIIEIDNGGFFGDGQMIINDINLKDAELIAVLCHTAVDIQRRRAAAAAAG